MSTTTERKLRVFLCHASQDEPVVRELYQRLLAEGWIEPWLDEEKLLPGQDWDMEIKIAVESADVVIVCISNSSVEKEGYIQKELRFALDIALEKPERTIFIIPLRLDNCNVPGSLKKYQYQDYSPNTKMDKAYLRLQKSLEARANKIGLPIKELREQYLRDLKIKREMLKRMSAKIRILVIDDDRNWLDVIKMMIKHIGYEVNGVDSLEELKTELEKSLVNEDPYSIVLTDVIFDVRGHPISLGKYIVSYVKNNYPNIECTLLTGARFDPIEIMSLRDEYDVAYVLYKDMIEVDTLSETIKKMIVRAEK